MNYEKIHAYMVLTNWTWGAKGIPSVEQLKECVEKLKADCPRPGNSCETGGFLVRRMKDETGLQTFEVCFMLCSEEQEP